MCIRDSTYTLAVSQETAKKYGLKTMKDLLKCDSQLALGTTLEFQNRPDDGLPGLLKKYGFNFKETVGIDGSPRFTALKNGDTDIVDAYATDGLLKKYNLKVLEDSDGFFPPYYACLLYTSGIKGGYERSGKELLKLTAQNEQKIDDMSETPVSYTHLDVYKRQV